jgi:hypothetical protein
MRTGQWQRPGGGYLHNEAFCLMKYATKDGAEVEWIWNSRDGVTPFVVHSRSGQEMSHVQWQFDRRLPNYEPLAGERVFVDMSPEYPMSRAYEDKGEAVRAMTAEYLGDGDRPTLIEAAEWLKGR